MDGNYCSMEKLLMVGMRAYKQTFPEKDWIVTNGTITVFESKGKEGGEGGDIVTIRNTKRLIFHLNLD